MSEHVTWWSAGQGDNHKRFTTPTDRKVRRISTGVTVIIALVVGLLGGVGGA
jgi:hypothetical protein